MSESNNTKILYVPTQAVHAIYNANEVHVHYYPADAGVVPETCCSAQNNAEPSSQKETIQDRIKRFIDSMLTESDKTHTGPNSEKAKNTKWLLEQLTLKKNALHSMLKSDTSLANVEALTITIASLSLLLFEAVQ